MRCIISTIVWMEYCKVLTYGDTNTLLSLQPALTLVKFEEINIHIRVSLDLYN